MPYVFAILAMISIGSLGLLSKVAENRGYAPLMTTNLLFGSAAAMMALYVLVFGGAQFAPPRVVTLTGLLFGALAVLAFSVFLYGLQFGKITTSWVFINLSAAVPAVLSTMLYKEPLGLRKIGLLFLVVVSILLLWKDRMSDSHPARNSSGGKQDATKQRS